MRKPLAYDPPRAGIDLHIHSTASDGSLTPSELLEMAVQLGLKAIAITDHDTLSGSVAALTAGIPSALRFLTGIEISAAAPPGFQLSGSIHILGYGIDPENASLNSLLGVLKTSRENRNPQIIARLGELGFRLDADELSQIVGDAVAGRPHIAQLMVAKGMAESIDDAFNRFLGKNKPAYVEKFRVPMTEAIAAINHAGGIAVLAHPYLCGLNEPDEFERFLKTLQSMGLRGIEAFYPGHSEADTDTYCRLAAKYDLIITGGTDYHGDVTPEIRMGNGDGRFHVPVSVYENLAANLKLRS